MSKPANENFDQMMKRVRKDAEKRRENLVQEGEKWLSLQNLFDGGYKTLKGDSVTAIANRAAVREVASKLRGRALGYFFLWAKNEGFDLNEVAIYADSFGDTELYGRLQDKL